MTNDKSIKLCQKCWQIKPRTKEFFPTTTYKKSGFSCYCRDCEHERKRKYERENPEKVRASIKKRKGRYKEKLKAYRRVYYEKNKGEWVRYLADRRARKNDAGGSYDKNDVLSLFGEQNGKCFYCGVELDSGFHVDHRIPLCRGGSNDKSNLALACAPCNLSKHAKTDKEFLEDV